MARLACSSQESNPGFTNTCYATLSPEFLHAGSDKVFTLGQQAVKELSCHQSLTI